MNKIIFFTVMLAVTGQCYSQQPVADPVLLGATRKEVLMSAPYDKWFMAGYNNYHPDVSVVDAIKKTGISGITIDIFFGSWCGDSRREIPRFQKMIDELSFSQNQVTMIGLGSRDSLFKQSPAHEEMGKGIFRVPVFIVYKNGIELGRINEFPVFSLEKDFSTIISKKYYLPNYRSFALIREWLRDGTLLDKNVSYHGLATQLRQLTESERDLNSLGYLLLDQKKNEEALRIFQVNASLYALSAVVLSSLGEGYYKTGDLANAVRLLEQSLEVNRDPQLVKPILKVLYQAKGLRE